MSINKVLFSTMVGVLMLGACSTDYFNQTEGNMPSRKDIVSLKQGMTED